MTRTYMEGKTETTQDVTTRLSPVSLLARFCNLPEVKFHAFRRLKRGEEKSILKKMFDFLIRTSCRFDQANNKKSVIYTLKLYGYDILSFQEIANEISF